MTAPSGLDKGFMLPGVGASTGFRNEGSRKGEGLEGLAKSLVAVSAAGVCSEGALNGMGSFGGEAIDTMKAAEEKIAEEN